MVVTFVNLKGLPSLILGDPLIAIVLTTLSIMHGVSPTLRLHINIHILIKYLKNLYRTVCFGPFY